MKKQIRTIRTGKSKGTIFAEFVKRQLPLRESTRIAQLLSDIAHRNTAVHKRIQALVQLTMDAGLAYGKEHPKDVAIEYFEDDITERQEQ